MELRTALIVFGLVVLAIVTGVSIWRLRPQRHRLKDSLFHRRSDDSLEPILPHTRIAEPAQVVPKTASVLSTKETLGVVLNPEDREDTASEALRAAEQVANMPVSADPDLASVSGGAGNQRQIDFLARIPGEDIITRDEALSVYRQNEYLVDKPHRIFGLSYPARNWVNLDKEPDFGRYSDLGLAVQLADQKGPITESALTRFSLLVLRLSETLGRPFKFSMTFDEAQQQAAELDEFCKTYDVLGILNIVSKLPQGFSGEDIDRYAREFGLERGHMNIYHKKNDKGRGGGELFSLANLYKPGDFPNSKETFSTKGLTLFMSMPYSYQPGGVFQQMAETADGLCKKFDGRLVDQGRRSLTPRGLEHTQQELQDLGAAMEQDGISPGSEAALRLF